MKMMKPPFPISIVFQHSFGRLACTALVATLFCCSTFAATIESAQSGAWNLTSTWSGGVVPGASDDVIIKAGHTVSLNDARSCITLTIEAPAVFNLGSSLTQSGAFLNQGMVNWTNGSFAGTGSITNDGTLNIASISNHNTNTDITNNANKIINWNDGLIDANADGQTLTNFGTFNLIGNNPNNQECRMSVINHGSMVKPSIGTGTAPFAYAVTNNGSLEGVGTMTFNSTLTQNGNIAPGLSPGIPTLSSSAISLTNSAGLIIGIQDNTGAGTGHDRLIFTGTVALNGSLTVTETGTVMPDNFTILTCNGGANCRTGTYSTLDLPPCYTLGYTGNSVILTKNPPPVSEITGDMDICLGESTTLTAAGGVTYLWSNSATSADITVNPLAGTDYSVTVADATGCLDSITTTVVVHPLPSASISGNLSICLSENTTLTASGGNSFLWDNGAVSADTIVSPALTTNYSVVVTDANGCTDEATVTVTIIGPILAWYADLDMDGFGDPNTFVMDCVQPPGTVANNEDCDDTNVEVFPGANEVCNGIDDNCDTQIDEMVTSLPNVWTGSGDGSSWDDPSNWSNNTSSLCPAMTSSYRLASMYLCQLISQQKAIPCKWIKRVSFLCPKPLF